MKTLSDLKKHAHIYEWALVSNSWFKQVPDFQASYRTVTRVQSTKLALKTIKDGVISESWIDFPKASELTITLKDCEYILTINRIIPADLNMQREESIHTMVYKLRPDLASIGVAA
jgi:hypothetical protein